MAALYPSAGSAYTYVARGLNPSLGFLAGWAMLLDYIVMPLFCVILSAISTQRLIPQVPYWVLATLFASGMTVLNLCGIKSVARVNRMVLGAVSVVFAAFFVLAISYIHRQSGWTGLFAFWPLYNPPTFSFGALAAGTSFAALNYLGFDSVTTLAEDVENPRRNVYLATVGVCVFIGLFSAVVVYLGQLVWPNYHTFPNIETGFMDVTRLVGGNILFVSMAVLLILSAAGSGVTAQAGAARLLFGFGRDNVLPPKIFAYLDPKHNNPTRNILIAGAVAFVGSFLMNYEMAADVLVCGAFVGFMGVDLAAIRQFYILGQPGYKRRLLTDVIVPGLGFLFCLAIAWGLPKPVKILGAIWFLAGIGHIAFQTGGFRRPLVVSLADPPEWE
jgi:amino acid transporter